MKLYHYINGNEIADDATIAQVLENGLQANRGKWTDIDELLPSRPKGIFFWGEDNIKVRTSDLVSLDTSDLDTDKLYAFPAEAAQVADMAICGYELVPAAYDFMAEARAVPFSEFKGQFAAEWIYTSDIPGSVLSKEK